MVPVPKVLSFGELNNKLLADCLNYPNNHKVAFLHSTGKAQHPYQSAAEYYTTRYMVADSLRLYIKSHLLFDHINLYKMYYISQNHLTVYESNTFYSHLMLDSEEISV